MDWSALHCCKTSVSLGYLSIFMVEKIPHYGNSKNIAVRWIKKIYVVLAACLYEQSINRVTQNKYLGIFL